MKTESVIFDFDGTLADSMSIVYLLTNDYLAEFGYRPLSREDIDEMRSMTVPQIMKKVGVAPYKVPKMALRAKKLMQENIDQLNIAEGIPELLSELSENKVRMGILTSNSLENVEKILKRYDLIDYFEFIDTGASLLGKSRKIKSNIKKNKMKLEATLYIGDEVRDINAANDISMKSIAVSWGVNSVEALKKSKPTKLVSNTDELLSVILL